MSPYLLVVIVIFIVLKNIHRRVERERTIVFNDKKKNPKQTKAKESFSFSFLFIVELLVVLKLAIQISR